MRLIIQQSLLSFCLRHAYVKRLMVFAYFGFLHAHFGWVCSRRLLRLYCLRWSPQQTTTTTRQRCLFEDGSSIVVVVSVYWNPDVWCRQHWSQVLGTFRFLIKFIPWASPDVCIWQFVVSIKNKVDAVIINKIECLQSKCRNCCCNHFNHWGKFISKAENSCSSSWGDKTLLLFSRAPICRARWLPF